MAYRATPHDTTGESPNMMLTGRQMTLPLDVISQPEREEKTNHKSGSEYVRKLLRDLRACHQRVREMTGRAAMTQKKYYDKRAFLNKYQRGDLVLIKAGKRLPGIGKWQEKWLGPYVVLHTLPSPALFRVQKDKGLKTDCDASR